MAALRSPLNDNGPEFSVEFDVQQLQWEKQTWDAPEQITLSDLHGNAGIAKCVRCFEETEGVCHLVSFGVDLASAPLKKWIKLCQSFVKFEKVLNLILKVDSDATPTSGDDNTNPRSNKEAMMQAHEQESGFQEETRSNNFNPVLHKWIQHCSELEALHHLACPNPGQTYKNPHLEQLYKLTILTDPVLQPNAAKFCFAGQPVGLPEHITTITNLIQFCHKFVHNSMHFKSPLPLTENETLPE